jgi:NADPH:quinone reductase-like Zn-dependent oxidoreductase
VEIKAISVIDYKVRATVPADDDAWKVIGWDASGIIKEVGADVTLFRLAMKSGMQAISLVKGLMHNTKLNERIVGTKPSSLSYAEAAALPLTTLTAWELFDRLQVAQDDTSKSILVIAAAGV